MPQPKTEFRNATDRTIGVVTIEPGGREVALPLVPGASIWLTEDEEISTANAPARDEDNPFATGALVPVGKPENLRNRRPIGSAQAADENEEQQRVAAKAEAERRQQEQAEAKAGEEARLKAGREEAQRGGARPAAPPAQTRQTPEETGAPPQPQGKAAEGSRAAGEEVGTPEAASAS